MARVVHRLVVLSVLALCACRGDAHRATASTRSELFLYDGLGGFHRPVTTAAPDAQRWIDQGIVLAWAFNHDEAIRSFQQALRIDPSCAMGWWGIAFANGPHINNPALDPEHAASAWFALQKALELAPRASPVERALIEALARRYSADPSAERAPLDAAYADAMRAVWRAFPADLDVATWFAESLMDLRPWDLWTNAGEPQPGTEELVGVLETVLAQAPDHPGACHLYVHTMEASPRPEKALSAADRLRTLVPDAGHLVHMPAHIDLRLGRYADASAANQRAVIADAKHRALFPPRGFYRVYMAHNHHFLAFAEMMRGRSTAALDAARAMVEGVPPEFIEIAGPVIDGYLPIVLHTLVRFGRWEEILRVPASPTELTVSNSVRHYARGTALAALGRLEEAEQEQAALGATMAKIEAERAVGNNPASAVLAIARDMLAGEIAYRRGQRDAGIELLRKAKAAEDELRYDEPPDWMMPVRHALGAMLVQSGRFEEAERIYREDLRRFPENGWSLFGLERALRTRGAAEQAYEVEKRFEKAWKKADVELHSSCFCQPGIE